MRYCVPSSVGALGFACRCTVNSRVETKETGEGPTGSGTKRLKREVIRSRAATGSRRPTCNANGDALGKKEKTFFFVDQNTRRFLICLLRKTRAVCAIEVTWFCLDSSNVFRYGVFRFFCARDGVSLEARFEFPMFSAWIWKTIEKPTSPKRIADKIRKNSCTITVRKISPIPKIVTRENL